ncbi:hypothetical protein BFP72_17425 [Reichenbachiella sp. 5M10]|uniref:EF-hand domain-containing protein n=1 Tax=Reichenbachiella sp. 5M10 TaxID=1889772 RepID=UPI000C14F5D3|nr:EF-hand domain-containing protein [Reichenbachiella sp. 5M10]PIB37056.1 hypothetical protein BFP72_17425 [Reichenbachiella sp. 5M10]
MLSPLQVEKLTHFFNIIDFDRSGTVEKDDFEAIGENLCIVRDFDFDTPEYATVISMTDAIWSNLSPYVEGDHATLDQWLEYMTALLDPDNLETYKKYVVSFTTNIFKLFDLNEDRVISQNEYIDLFIGLRIEVRFAPKAFRSLDDNNDGKLSYDEVIKSVDQFMRSSDPKALGNWLFGGWETDD